MKYINTGRELASENIRFSSLFVAEDASTSSATQSEEKRMFSQARREWNNEIT